ncbi:dTDP-4-dehydrorhamnose 3,5-epimerase family protein [Streptomyces sp. NPDC054796]
METRELKIEGAFAFTPPVFKDRRGLFSSPYQGHAFEAALGKPLFPVRQVSHNLSAPGVLRGIHYSATPPGTAKYVYCPKGRVQDFLIDLRVGSPTFGTWETAELDEDNCGAFYVPVGVGHAFMAMEEGSMVTYLLSGEYVAKNELAVDPLDPAIGLAVPTGFEPLQSERDLAAPTLAEAEKQGLLPAYEDCKEAEARLWP